MAFFEPRRNRVARDAKHAREATQGGALVIGSQNLVFTFVVIAFGLWVLAQTAPTGATLETLFAVAGLAVLMNLVAATVITLHTTQSDKYSLL